MNDSPATIITTACGHNFVVGDKIVVDVWHTPWWFRWLWYVLPTDAYRRFRHRVGMRLGHIHVSTITFSAGNVFEVK